MIESLTVNRQAILDEMDENGPNYASLMETYQELEAVVSKVNAMQKLEGSSSSSATSFRNLLPRKARPPLLTKLFKS